MTRLSTFAIALACLGLSVFLIPVLAQTAGQEQLAEKSPQANDALKRIEELRVKLDKIDRELQTLRPEEAKDDETPKRKEESKADAEKRSRRAKALESEREVALALLIDVLKDAPSPTTRQENLAILGMLGQPMATKGLHEKVKLKQALEYVWNQWHGKLVILVDREAFAAGLGADAPDPYEEEVSLPPVPAKLAMGVALRLLLAQVGQGQATFVIRQGYVQITTLKASTAAHALQQNSIFAAFDRQPLQEILEHLSNESGLAIYLDPNLGKKGQVAISAKFQNMTLEDALVTVTEMAELKYVVLQRSVYVTTPEKAIILRDEEKKRAALREEFRKSTLPKAIESAP